MKVSKWLAGRERRCYFLVPFFFFLSFSTLLWLVVSQTVYMFFFFLKLQENSTQV